MKRTTISLPDELAQKLKDYRDNQTVKPSVSGVVRRALEEFLNKTGLEYELAIRGITELKDFPKEIYTIDETLTDKSDVSINHDKYFAEAVADDY